MSSKFSARLQEEAATSKACIDYVKMEQSRISSKYDADRIDAELRKGISPAVPYVRVIGVGGAGSNAVSRIERSSIPDTETVVVNTDARHLLSCNADKKVLIGYELTEGLGAGNDPLIGRAAAEESAADLHEVLLGAKMVFITAGMGGGTGTGAAACIAKIAKEEGALVVGVVTLPFATEGTVRTNNALEGLEQLNKEADAVIIIPNEKLLIFAPNLSVGNAFNVADQILIHAVIGIAELVTNNGFVNVDFGDVKRILGDKGPCVIGFGEGEGENRVEIALDEALNNPLLDVDMSSCSNALVFVVGGSSLVLSELDQIIAHINKGIDKDSEIIWGASIIPEMGEGIRITVCLAGVKTPYLEVLDEDMIEELWNSIDKKQTKPSSAWAEIDDE